MSSSGSGSESDFNDSDRTLPGYKSPKEDNEDYTNCVFDADPETAFGKRDDYDDDDGTVFISRELDGYGPIKFKVRQMHVGMDLRIKIKCVDFDWSKVERFASVHLREWVKTDVYGYDDSDYDHEFEEQFAEEFPEDDRRPTIKQRERVFEFDGDTFKRLWMDGSAQDGWQTSWFRLHIVAKTGHEINRLLRKWDPETNTQNGDKAFSELLPWYVVVARRQMKTKTLATKVLKALQTFCGDDEQKRFLLDEQIAEAIKINPQLEKKKIGKKTIMKKKKVQKNQGVQEED